jgi:RNA polymerase sigma-70 factor (ECF subfamily)
MDDHNITAAPLAFAGRAHADAADQDAAFEALYQASFARVYAMARWQLGDADAAQDVVSQTFLKAFEHRRRAPAGEGMTLWLFRIARNTVIDYLRVHRRRASHTTSLDELVEPADAGESPEGAAGRRERRAHLLRALAELPERDRAVLALKFGAQRTNREVSQILDLSEGAVSMRLLRALRRLRQECGDME